MLIKNDTNRGNGSLRRRVNAAGDNSAALANDSAWRNWPSAEKMVWHLLFHRDFQ